MDRKQQANGIEKRIADVLDHLNRAQGLMGGLTAVTGDWTACVQLQQAFRNVEKEVKRFARYQLGIGVRGNRAKPAR